MEKDRKPREFRSPHGSPGAAAPFRQPPPATRSQIDETIDEAIARHRDRLLAIDGVQGLDHGYDAAGADVIRVHITGEPVARNVPGDLDGHPVITVVTGTYEAH